MREPLDWKEKLQHYQEVDNEMLVDEAIAALEGIFKLMETDTLLHRSKQVALPYLALRHIRDSKL